MPYGIRICTGLEEGEVYPLFDNREITVGRSPTNNVFVRDKNVSRVHCQIVITEVGVTLSDLQSTNGTFVNGVRQNEIQLEVGDEIRLGTTLLRLEEVADTTGSITDTALLS
jgi:pSer/pThr/pTyr-binding forkhead associated (FHA) protein